MGLFQEKVVFLQVEMKIAVLTSGRLPVPAVCGGAVENLIDFYLEYNEREGLHDITTYSIYDSKLDTSTSEQHNHYRWMRRNWITKIAKKIYARRNETAYYDDDIEYFLDWTIKKLKNCRYDMIVVENRPGYGRRLRKEFPNTPLLLHLHNDMISKNDGDLADCFDKVLTISDFLKQRVIQANGNARVATVYNGIDTKRFARRPKNVELRKKLRFDDNDFVVVYSGRLVPEKGVRELLYAFELLNDRPSIKLLVVGGAFYGGTADSDFSNSLKQQMHQMGERVRFTGFLEYSRVPDCLSAADAAIVPSVWDECFGLTVAEAMSIGLPVITTRSGGIPEIVNSEHCILVERGEGMARRLSEALIEMKENYSKYAGNVLDSKFTKEQYARNFFNALQL